MRKKIFITVKTYPTISYKYGELVCTAGFTEVTLGTIAASSIYIAIISVVLTFIQVFLFDRKIKKGGKK